MNGLTKIILSISFLLLAYSLKTNASAFEKKFALTIEKLVKASDGNFALIESVVADKEIILPFDHSKIVEEFDGFTLEIISYVGLQNSGLTVEQNLRKIGHPLNDEIIGISRNHFTLDNPRGNQVSYINYYVNVDNNTKYRIRLWDMFNR